MHQYNKFFSPLQLSDKSAISHTFQILFRHCILPEFYHSFTKRAFFFPGKSPQFSTKYFVDNVDIFVYKSIFPRFSVFFSVDNFEKLSPPFLPCFGNFVHFFQISLCFLTGQIIWLFFLFCRKHRFLRHKKLQEREITLFSAVSIFTKILRRSKTN